MARVTHDREDLLLEATALVPRVMLVVDIQGRPCEVFAGFRGDSVSFYFGASPVYHFNGAGELRRAFVDDCLIKAESGWLVASTRERSHDKVSLASRPLTAEESSSFETGLEDRFTTLSSSLTEGSFQLIGQVPHDSDAVSKLKDWLANWQGLRIADVPNVS
jgi:hypothetical protein